MENGKLEQDSKMYNLVVDFWNNLQLWVSTLSERALSLSGIAILHCAFITNLLAVMNSITDKTPGLDAYLLVSLALFIMCLRSILINDKIATLIHVVGFCSQLSVLALIILR